MEKAAADQAEDPELELLLSGCASRQQREAVLDAFHAFAGGDHKGGISLIRLLALRVPVAR